MKHRVNIDILVCTYNEGIKKVKNLLLDPQENINYRVSHQITKSDLNIEDCDFLNRPDVEYSVLHCRGLSKNRNNVLRMAKGDICFIADDDVLYELSNINRVAEIFSQHPELDVFVGRIKTYENEPEYKKYLETEQKLGWSNIGSVSSIEMVVRRESIFENSISFDERFGLGGSLYPKGEEAIFLSDCLKKKLNLTYYPIYIVKHPKESSASDIPYDHKEVEYMGALSNRIFNKLSLFVGVLFCVKHHRRYKSYLSPISYLKYFYSGMRKYKK